MVIRCPTFACGVALLLQQRDQSQIKPQRAKSFRSSEGEFTVSVLLLAVSISGPAARCLDRQIGRLPGLKQVQLLESNYVYVSFGFKEAMLSWLDWPLQSFQQFTLLKKAIAM